VQKGGQVKMLIKFSASTETEVKNYKASLNVLSGPKYDFNIIGQARKPGVRLN